MIGTYREAMDFLLKRTDFENLKAEKFLHSDFKLDRMRALLEALGHPEVIPAIHVAGTKGKGSTATMIASGLTACGHKTGLLTSPHLERFEERIRIDGEMIPPDAVVSLCDRLFRSILERPDAAPHSLPTYFELTTALAWLWFRERSVDVVVLEVGLGGRLDATNLCHPEVCVITSIGLDHTQQLGHTLGEIAFEKAGIIKPKIPVVSGVCEPDARAVIRKVADDRGSTLWELERDIHVKQSDSETFRRWNINTPWGGYRDLSLSLQGAHQGRNVALALAAIELFQSPRAVPDRKSIARAVSQVTLPGRQELISREPLVLLDSAHNVDSTKALVNTLCEPPFLRTRKIVIFGCSSDKDIEGQFELLSGLIDRWIFTQVTESPRSCAVESLLAFAASQRLGSVTGADNPEQALSDAWEELGESTCLIVTGSFFLSGKLRTLILDRLEKQHVQPASARLPASIPLKDL